MGTNNMSKESFQLCQKLYDEYGINYHDIEISALNHLDFVQQHKPWNDILGGKSARLMVDGLGSPLMISTECGTMLIEPEIWQPDYIDLDLYLKLKADLISLVNREIENENYELIKIGYHRHNRALVSTKNLWTANERSVLGDCGWEGEKWVELYDNNARGYILPGRTFHYAFKRK